MSESDEQEADEQSAGDAATAGELSQLDRTVHEPARLAILVILAVVERADFTYVKNQAGLSGGNLASHLAKLEAAGLVAVEKSFEGRRPQTNLSLTPAGREALVRWRAQVGRLMDLLP